LVCLVAGSLSRIDSRARSRPRASDRARSAATDAHARRTLLLLDERFNRPSLRQAIPERFRAAVVLGAQEGQEHQMTQRKRSIRRS
jgi:hypothetical protein